MECLIQVFPDEFHLATLQPFLSSCAQLTQNVNVKNIIIALIDRLAMSKDIELPADLFDIFAKQISQIITTRNDISLEDIVLMKGSLINFSLKKISDVSKREESVNCVLDNALTVIKDKNQTNVPLRSNLGKELFKFFKLPLNCGSTNGVTGLSPIKMSLKLKAYKDLLKQTAAYDLHKEVTLSLINSALEHSTDVEAVAEEDRLSRAEIETFLSEICDPLINGKNGDIGVIDENDEDFIDEQLLLSRFIHFLFLPQAMQESEHTGNYFLLLKAFRKTLAAGG
ncbi:unnamed protein product, partial [Medioppia subpectinata]